ncbi:TPA: protein Eaa [Enterobacter hormaechei subsp. xiangfangensis]
MSTLTKEWLHQTIADLEEERDATPGAVNEDAAKALAAMKLALASLEAEAVAEVCEGFTLRYIGHGPAPKSGVHIGDRLYTAPPASVSVPDERQAFNAWNNDTDCPLAGRDAKTAAWLAWNRRAAMLQEISNEQ